jgi:hypothetical protein
MMPEDMVAQLGEAPPGGGRNLHNKIHEYLI